VTSHLLFVGGYAAADAPGIQAFTLDNDGFSRCGEFAGIVNPSFLALHPALGVLYAVSETAAASDGTTGTVHAMRIERSDDRVRFTPHGHRPTGGENPCHVAIHPEGHTLVVVNYSGGTVTAYPLAADGAIGAAEPSFEHAGSGPNPQRQEGPHPHSSLFSPDGRFVIVADLGIDRLLVHRVTAPGRLVHETALAVTPGSGPRHMAFHPDGTHLFVVGELDNSLSVHQFDAATGRIRQLAAASTVPDDAPAGTTAADVQVAPGGDRVYVSNRRHDSIAVFSFERRLTRIAAWPSGGRRPRAFAPTPLGDAVVVANRDSGTLARLSTTDGAVTATVATTGIDPSAVAFAGHRRTLSPT
jgi:6-phosphogluconolactonase